MAKMFYTIEEARQVLTKSEEEVKQLAKEGRLREFRDGPRLMFKADQVDALKVELEGPDPLTLSGSEGSGALGLVDSKTGLPSGSGMPSGSGLAGIMETDGRSPAPGLAAKEDTALAADLGLSGSVGGMPSPGRSASGSSVIPTVTASPGGSAASMAGQSVSGSLSGGSVAGASVSSVSGSKVGSVAGQSAMGSKAGSMAGGSVSGSRVGGSVGGSTGPGGSAAGMPGQGTRMGGSIHGSRTGASIHGTRAGVDVLRDDDDAERVDPSAQTAITGGLSEQVNIESVGSGSGLLDLTRESDDTSLGAELLDEIAPGSTASGSRRAPSPGDTAAATAAMTVAETRAAGAVRTLPAGAVQYEERLDPMSPAFAGAALGASLFVFIGAFALICGMSDATPTFFQYLAQYKFLILALGGLGLPLIFFLVGILIGKSVTG